MTTLSAFIPANHSVRYWPNWDRPRLILAVLAALILLVFVATHSRFGSAFFTVDSHLYYAHAHSWYFDHDCDYANNMRADPGFQTRDAYQSDRTEFGHTVNIFPCGWSLLALPFLAMADGLTIVHNFVSTMPRPRDGFTGYYGFMVPLGHVLWGWVGLWATYALAARYFARDIAAVCTILLWAGTNVYYFISVEPTMSHAASLLCVSMLLLATDSIHRLGWTTGRAIALGAWAGLTCAVRYQDIAWVIVPMALLVPPQIQQWIRHRPGGWRGVQYMGLALLVAAICLSPQAFINFEIHHTLFGRMGRFAPDFLHPHFIRDLLALPGGWFVLFPLSALSVVGLLVWMRTAASQSVAGCYLLGLFACIYLNACGIEGTARRYVCATPVLALGLCALWGAAQRSRRRVALFGAAVLLAVLSNLTVMSLVESGKIDRFLLTSVVERPVHWARLMNGGAAASSAN